MSYSIPVAALKASLFCASKKDVRYHLNGALLDFQKGRIVSTDGHSLFVGKIPHADMPSVICPRETIESAVKLAGKNGADCEIEIAPAPGQQPTIRLLTLGGTVHASAIDGRYPEYERVIPASTSGETGQFTPDVILTARNALNTYMGRDPKRPASQFQLNHNGLSAATMVGTDCFCVVLGLRSTADGDMSWFHEKPELAIAA
jgi:hypothetical protein